MREPVPSERSTWSVSRQAERPEGKGVDASQALAEAMGSIQAQTANKPNQDTNQA